MLESQAEFGKKSGSNQERTQELLGHPDAYHILFPSGRSQIKQLCNSIWQKTYLASFAQVHEALYFHYYIDFGTLGFQVWL